MIEAQMLAYNHTFDPEYARLALASDRTVLRNVKLQALIGKQVVLSDVQLIDSPYILDLFGKQDFLGFLAENRDFLSLASTAAPDEEPAWSKVTAGLRAARNPNWRSSIFPTADWTRSLAKNISAAAVADEKRPLNEYGIEEQRVAPQHVRLLSGLLGGVRYFASNPSQVLEALPHQERTDLYKVLTSLETRAELSAPVSKRVSKTLNYIRGRITDDKDRSSRSAILSKLENDSRLNRFERFSIWSTVVQAWNSAVQRSVRARGASAQMMRSSGTLTSYFDDEADFFLPITRTKAILRAADRAASTGVAFLLSADVETLSWSRISEVNDSCRRTRTAVQMAAAGDAATRHRLLKEHAWNVAKTLDDRSFTKHGPHLSYLYFLSSRLTPLIGDRNTEILGVASAILGGSAMARSWAKRHLVAETIQRSVKKD
jgi:hypothetical protein